jgi:hypothetical protein
VSGAAPGATACAERPFVNLEHYLLATAVGPVEVPEHREGVSSRVGGMLARASHLRCQGMTLLGALVIWLHMGLAFDVVHRGALASRLHWDLAFVAHCIHK